jgi:hypothetical protein
MRRQFGKLLDGRRLDTRWRYRQVILVKDEQLALGGFLQPGHDCSRLLDRCLDQVIAQQRIHQRRLSCAHFADYRDPHAAVPAGTVAL